MPELTLIRDLAVVLIVAAAVTILFHRLRQPVVLGYIVAGVIIGPHTPPFPLVRDSHNIETMANLGIVFLMFSLGLEFNLRKLRQLGPAAGTAAFLSALLMIWLGYGVGRFFGWGRMDSLFLGAIVSISSSTIIVKTFQSLGKLSQSYAQMALAFMLIEDIIAVVILGALSGIALTGTLEITHVLTMLSRVGVFIVVVLLFGMLLVPRLITFVGRFNDNEVLVVTALGLCFGLAILAVRLGFSVALGAFIMGAIVSESREADRLPSLIAPLRDLFVAVFFVAVGMLLDPHLIVKYIVPVLGVALLAIVGRSFIAAFATYTTGLEGRTALLVGLGLTPLGEFSFIIAQLGATTHVTGHFLFPVAVGASAITSLTAPFLVRSSDPLVAVFERLAPKPLTTFLALYSKWVGSLRASGRSSNLWRFVRKPLLMVVIEVSVITALFVSAAFAVEGLTRVFPNRLWFDAEIEVLVWLAAMLVSLPPFLAVWRNVEVIALLLAESAVPTLNRQGAVRFDVQRLLKNVFVWIGAVTLGLWIVALSSSILPSWPLLLGLVVIAVLIARRQWHAIVLLHSRVEAAVREVFSELPHARPKPTQEAEILNLIKEKYPWDFELRELTLPRESAAAGRTIRDLALRSRTGASIVGIEREGFEVVNPSPGVPLFPGDGLVLMGQTDQIEAARRVLLETVPKPVAAERLFSSIEVETVVMGAGSPLIGRTIADSRIRSHTGAAVIGIQRGDQRLPAPGADTRIEPGDLLLLLGSRPQLDAAKRLASGSG